MITSSEESLQNHLMVGNGGDAGFIVYTAMQTPVNKYGFAVASTVSVIPNSHFDKLY